MIFGCIWALCAYFRMCLAAIYVFYTSKAMSSYKIDAFIDNLLLQWFLTIEVSAALIYCDRACYLLDEEGRRVVPLDCVTNNKRRVFSSKQRKDVSISIVKSIKYAL
ncbi:hypothetical protein COOONC_09313 [Cooperia oncophora]